MDKNGGFVEFLEGAIEFRIMEMQP